MKEIKEGEHIQQRKCIMCNKLYKAKAYVEDDGLLKGNWIISSVFCGNVCSKKFEKQIKKEKKR